MGFEIKTILSSPKDGEKLPNPYMRPIETIKKKEEEQKRKDEEDVRAIEKQLGIGTNYHEGLNRELRTIYISNTLKDHAPNLVQELQEI
ncbi:MAG: hypothetical protein LBU27_09930 [Candidatus Peribacteria bacterium]|jgi:hypothetical protein|nr:hypothetical protein [Candidatus Peribacteria bacterium]